MTTTAPHRHRAGGLRRFVTAETTGGALLLLAALTGLIWANSPWRGAYQALSSWELGPEALHLRLPLATWASDGLLAVFFFVVGLELKHETVAGSLRRVRESAVPVVAAVGGMAAPALIYVVVLLVAGERGALHGWAIPTATDIAFALAVLAVFGRRLPRALRAFLLALAVVDDLLGIVVIAVFYTGSIQAVPLGLSLAMVGVFWLFVRARRLRWWWMVPTAVLAWGFLHASGVHATIAGVLLGTCVPAILMHGESQPRTEQLSYLVNPLSSGLMLPVFAFFAAGVTLVGGDGPAAVLGQPVVPAIVLALVVGKFVGVLGTTTLVTKLTPLRLPDAIGLRDLLPLGFLAGIGFTVSLLITQLSFPDAEHVEGAKVAVLGGSLISALLAAAALRWDARKARSTDMNEDGQPDVAIEPIE